MDKPIHVFRKIVNNGVVLKISGKKYPLIYPYYIWKKFPHALHRLFADSFAYASTWHLPLINKSGVVYHFPHPSIEPIFFKLLMYSIPMNIFEFKNVKTSDLLKRFYNSSFSAKYRGLNYFYSGKAAKQRLKDTAILLFSFGKDSLLTYAILEELGVNTIPIFIREPFSSFENAHKRKLAENFYKQFEKDVVFFPLKSGRLRQTKGLYWGWDLLLTQYSFVLLPYFFYYQARYLFFGNEQMCNITTHDEEGYEINPVFEQSVPAMQIITQIPKLFFINTHAGSLIEPFYDHLLLYVLHRRYPEIGRYQMSCFSEAPESKKRRWCAHCEKCARIFILLKALNISPDRVGFYNGGMLSSRKEKYYVIFSHKNMGSAFGASGLGNEEQLLAFYLAYKNGVKGELIIKFKRRYLKDVEKIKNKLIDKYFGIYSSYSLPSTLRKRVLNIFEKERIKALRYARKLAKS